MASGPFVGKGGGEAQVIGQRGAQAGDQHAAADVRQKLATMWCESWEFSLSEVSEGMRSATANDSVTRYDFQNAGALHERQLRMQKSGGSCRRFDAATVRRDGISVATPGVL